MSSIKNYTEEEYNKLEVKQIADDVIEKLGIDMTKWYFGEAMGDSSWFNVYFCNEQAENHSLSLDFLFRHEKWQLENYEITQD